MKRETTQRCRPSAVPCDTAHVGIAPCKGTTNAHRPFKTGRERSFGLIPTYQLLYFVLRSCFKFCIIDTTAHVGPVSLELPPNVDHVRT